jgi:GxxExxY protein
MILFEKESYAIMGACFEVYKSKGCGFTEPIYQECLEIEFEHLGLPVVAQPQLPMTYRGRTLKHRFVPDFVCSEKIILEIKAASKLTGEHRAQVLNYLHATGHQLGLLVNFGHFPKVEYERIANSRVKGPQVP